MMQMAIDQIIRMAPMRYSLVTAVPAMDMRLVVPGTNMPRCTLLRIARTHFDLVVAYVVSINVVQMAIVKVIGVTVMFYCDMSALWAMFMRVRPGVFLVVV